MGNFRIMTNKPQAGASGRQVGALGGQAGALGGRALCAECSMIGQEEASWVRIVCNKATSGQPCGKLDIAL